MYDIDELKKLYDRLKAQYPKYRMKFYGENFTLTLLYAKVEVNRTGCRIFVNEKLYDELPSEEVDDIDDLYELIEAFLLQIQHLGMTSGNETYIRIFVNEKLYDELPSEEVDDIDDLYELIEAFLLQIQHLGMTSGNETYITANNQAVRGGTRALLSSAVLSVGCFLIFLLTKDLLYLFLFFFMSGWRVSVSSSDASEGFLSVLGMPWMRSGFAP